ncbi:MAG: zinc ribbon domain-containing protein [Erysipelotrichaceae bacterium]|nr:zinc ribbon domain-containing protein [Erysipelotrichaceae bacterium]
MYCNHCGKEIKAGAKFCNHCGKTVADKSITYGIGPLGGWTCPSCKGKNSNAGRFCSSCGEPNPYIVACPNCSKEFRNQEKFCPSCGTALNWKLIYKQCQKCGTRNPLDSRYCYSCGSEL